MDYKHQAVVDPFLRCDSPMFTTAAKQTPEEVPFSLQVLFYCLFFIWRAEAQEP